MGYHPEGSGEAGEICIENFQYLKGVYMKRRGNRFSKACCDKTRSNGFKLSEGTFRLDIRKKFFTNRGPYKC